MTARKPIRPTLLETPCIEWQGATDWGGYGIRYIGGRNIRVHRLAWAEAKGPIPDGVLICHRCDNPPCFRLDHLFAGSGKSNAEDREHKKRSARMHPWQGRQWGKLSPEQVAEIRSTYGPPTGKGRRLAGDRRPTQKQLAQIYGVSQIAISRAIRGATYSE